jgi:phage tail sheath gpL-like
MSISTTSRAAGNAAWLHGASFNPSTGRLDRKPILFGTFDPSKTAITANAIYSIKSAEHAGALFGFGFQLHRMAMAFFRNWNGSQIDVIPITETSAAADGTITYSGTATETKTLKLYIAGDLVPVSVTKDMTAAQTATAVAAAITADKNLPVTAVVNGSVTTQVDLTSKSEGLWGNGITVDHCIGFQEAMPAGITAVVVAMADGAGTPVLTSAIAALGSGTHQNERWYTAGVNGGGLETTPMDALSVYNGEGDTESGNHDGEVGRFFYFLNGYTDAEEGDLATLQALTALRKEDRTNGVVYVPGSPSHPVEIACAAMAKREKMSVKHPETTVVDEILTGIIPGSDTDDFNGNTNLDVQCVKQGISTVRKDGSYVKLQNLVTFYRPDSVSFASNIWASICSLTKSQNIQEMNKSRFDLEKWKNISIVADKTKVTDITAKQKARDIDDVMGELISLARAYEKMAFLYNAKFTIDKITGSPSSYITIREGGTGFNYVFPVVYSGEGGITSGEIQADANTNAAIEAA